MTANARKQQAPRSARFRSVPSVAGPGTPGWLDSFDFVVAQESAGKDSQTALRHAALELTAAGLIGRLKVQHNDLGSRVEWHQVPQLAAEQARRNGLDLAVTRRNGPDLLDDIATRRTRAGDFRGFPDNGLRWCTSDHKRAPSLHWIEAQCEQLRERLNRPPRVLQIFGFRAAESGTRAQLPVFSFNTRQSAATKRHVYDWLPIHHMTTQQVWDDIRVSGIPFHPVYDLGISRLSCKFCVLASQKDLGIAKRLAPDVAAAYIEVEKITGHPFRDRGKGKPGLSLADIPTEPGPQGFAVHWLACPTCSVPVLANVTESARYCPAHAVTGPWAKPLISAATGCGA